MWVRERLLRLQLSFIKIFAAFCLITGCDAKQTTRCDDPQSADCPTSRLFGRGATASEVKVTGIKPLVAKPGQEVTVSGVHLNSDAVLRIGDQVVSWTSTDGATAKFLMPMTPRSGAFAITVSRKDQSKGSVDAAAKFMLADSAEDGYPIFMATPEAICAPTAFRDAAGDLQIGTKNCVDVSVDLTNLTAENIKSGVIINGVVGTLSSTLPDCSSNGQQSCVATGAYYAGSVCGENSSACYLPTYTLSSQPLKAISYDAIFNSAASIRTGTTLGSVAGSLGDCSSDGVTGCVTTTSFRSANMVNVIPTNIKNQVMIAGVTGALQSPNAWDLRVGAVVNDVTGKLKVNCRNRVHTAVYNYDGALASIPTNGVTTGTDIDYWDTIDDYNNNVSGLPTSVVSGWTNNDCGGVEATAGDNNVWKDVTTSNGVTTSRCDLTATNCTMQDKISGLWWSKQQSSSAWNTALNTCGVTLNTTTYTGNSPHVGYNGQNGWRLPTQKELYDAYNHGIRSAASDRWSNFANNNWVTETAFSTNEFWSSSTYSVIVGSAWFVNLGKSAGSVTGNKTSAYAVLCVRP